MLLEIFPWGHTFFELNGKLLEKYASAKDSGEIVEMQKSIFKDEKCPK